ncbi:PIN domain-containing protein [Flavobacterium sp.]|jgi:predicted nucleic acid-binding protein|uniref:PIN domain-containing protein n=1 Tax=Flavobacterium sp. TaxID=239 RepID=UPI0037C047E3
MKGIDFLVDTNFLINISLNNELVFPFLDYSYAISYVTEIELLGAFSISKINKKNAQNLIDNCFIIEMNPEIKKETILLKQKYKLKLPDAIIAATAIVYKLPFLTSDADFKNIKELNLIFLEK